MHKFLRAVGFSRVNKREELQQLISRTINESSEKSFTTFDNDVLLAEYTREFGPDMGIKVCGEMDSEDKFCYEYIYPYFKPSRISSREKSMIERHSDKNSFAGVCDDNKIGISIIYDLQNRMDYIKNSYEGTGGFVEVPLSLSALSDSGMIVMPLAKDSIHTKKSEVTAKKRNKLVEAARQGDEDAMESLTLDDLDVYSALSQKIKNADIYTLVDTFFMPFGVECDMYSVMGEIKEVKEVINTLTDESVVQMKILVNEMPIDICINKVDLFGEPLPGRRFKGNIWLQGVLNYS